MWRQLRQAGLGIGIVLLIPGVWGCDRTNSESSTSQSPSTGPRDGIGQRLGTDVTAQPSRTREAPQEDVPKIVAFGDSLTAGAGISAEESYPAELQRRLDASGYRYRVVNAVLGGHDPYKVTIESDPGEMAEPIVDVPDEDADET